MKIEEAQIAALQALDKRVQLAEMDHKERKVCLSSCDLMIFTLFNSKYG